MKHLRKFLLRSLTFLIADVWIPSAVFFRKPTVGTRDFGDENSVVFFPYATPACQIQHKMLAETVKARGARASLVSTPLTIESFTYPRDNEGFEIFQTVDNLSKKFLNLVGGDEILARGALDEYLKNCPVDYFFSGFLLPPNFQAVVRNSLDFAERALRDKSSIVIPDGAYLLNRSLLSVAYRQKKRAFVFNPDGDWLELAEGESENYHYFSALEKQENQHEADETLTNGSDYLRRRFLGKSDDFDSAEAFSGSESGSSAQRRKVLFLHVVRDANQVPISPSERGYSIFSSFFEWADFCLGEIASNQSEWFVKVHPSAKFYDGELEIQQRLFEKHGISKETVEGCPTTRQILANKMPVYTHSGTIALESAVFGYKSNVASNAFPPDIANVATSREDLQAQLQISPESPPECVDKIASRRAGTALRVYFQPSEPLLVPTPRQPDRRSQKRFFLSLFVQAFSLAIRVNRRETLVRLGSLAEVLLGGD